MARRRSLAWSPESPRRRLTASPALPWMNTPSVAAAMDQSAASEPVPIAQAETRDPSAEAPKPPSRRRVREGGTSFTWIAVGLVAAVAAGSVMLWLQDMGAPVADVSVVSAVVMVESAKIAPADLGSDDSAQTDSGSTDSIPTVLTPTDSAPAVTEIVTNVATVQALAAATEPVTSPAPTTVSDPAAAQIACCWRSG